MKIILNLLFTESSNRMDDYLINKITVIVVSKTVIQIINFIKKCNENLMNMKRIFGGLLTLQGIGGLIYSSVLFASNTSGTGNIKAVIVYGIISLFFCIAGISLIRNTKDELYLE